MDKMYDNKQQGDAMDESIMKEEDYVMRSFYTGNDIILGCARTCKLIYECLLRNVEMSVCSIIIFPPVSLG